MSKNKKVAKNNTFKYWTNLKQYFFIHLGIGLMTYNKNRVITYKFVEALLLNIIPVIPGYLQFINMLKLYKLSYVSLIHGFNYLNIT